MRNHIRKKLGIFIMTCSISLLPSFQPRDSIESHDSKVVYNGNYQVQLLNELLSTIITNYKTTQTEQTIPEPTLQDTNQVFIEVTKITEVTTNVEKSGYIDGLEESEYWWLCKIVMAEVGYASYQLQQVIACEVLNRYRCWYFPDTIEEVIMQPGQYYDGPPCFTDSNGVWREVEESDITDSVKKAVHSALFDGVDYSNGAFFHISPHLLSQSVVDNFYYHYGDPCLELEGGLFFTADLCDSLEEWQEKYILNN